MLHRVCRNLTSRIRLYLEGVMCILTYMCKRKTNMAVGSSRNLSETGAAGTPVLVRYYLGFRLPRQFILYSGGFCQQRDN